MDYAFTGGDVNQAAFQIFLEFYDHRTNTTVLRTLSAIGALSLEGLATHLNSLPAGDKPIGDVFIASHGNESGWLKVRLTAILPVNEVDYDNLAALGSRLNLDPATTTSASGGNPGTTIHFRACRIGQADAFMRLLKSSFGGNVRVSAAKHFFEYQFFTIGPSIRFVIEYLEYGFLVAVPEANRLRTRDQVVQAFRNYHNPVTNQPFKYFDGSAIPNGKWNEWVPRRAPVHNTSKPISFRLEAGGHAFSFDTSFRNESSTAPDAIPYTNPPANQAAARQLALAHLQTLPGYQVSPTNPYPTFQRNGFDDLASFVNGHTWTPATVQGTNALVGTRREYTLLVPIFDLTSNLLLHNLMPSTSDPGTPAAHQGLDENNAGLFWNQ